MRHLRVLTVQVLLLTLGVVVATLGRVLVLLTRSTKRGQPALLSALVAAVPMAAIAGRTNHHGYAAPGAIELSARWMDRRFQTGRLDDRRGIGDAPSMGLSLIAAAASGGPESLPPGLHLPHPRTKPIPRRQRQPGLLGNSETEVEQVRARGGLRQPGGSTAHGRRGSVERGP